MRKSEWTEDLASLVNRNNPEAKELLKDLTKRCPGFLGRLSGKNHVIIKHKSVPMCTASFSLTPSDRRALKNKRGDVERLILQVVQTQQTGGKVTIQK
jgi:hypothetical protein